MVWVCSIHTSMATQAAGAVKDNRGSSAADATEQDPDKAFKACRSSRFWFAKALRLAPFLWERGRQI